MNDSTSSAGMRLRAALGFGPIADGKGGAAAGASSASGSTGTAGSAGAGASGTGAGTEQGAAGLGIDEFIDAADGAAWAGVDSSRHSDMLALPGNALNAVELLQLRERNHLVVRDQVRRTGDRRTLMLDTVGLELMQALQRDIERSHFSQAAAGTTGPAPAVRDGSLVHTPIADPAPDSRGRDDLAPEDIGTMSERARLDAAGQRVALLALVYEAQGQAASDLAALNRAEGIAHALRDLQLESRGSGPTQLEETNLELRADRAEEVEAQFRAQSGASLTRAMRLASATQGRRLGLQNSLHGRAPR